MYKLTKIFLLSFFLINHNSLVSQPSITWEKIYNRPNTNSDGLTGICEADSGNFFQVGYTPQPPFGHKIWVIKINAYGDTIWSRVIGKNGGLAYTVVSSGDGGCVLTGLVDQAFTIKVNANGNVVWERYYGGLGVQCYKIIKTLDGGYIACGRINLQDGYVLKIDSAGNLQWQKTYPAKYFKFLYDVNQDKEFYYLTGTLIENAQDTAKALFIKLNNQGAVINEEKIRLHNRGTVGLRIFRSDPYFILSGSTSNKEGSIETPFFLKIDSNAKILYEKIFDLINPEYFGDMKNIRNNKFIIVTLKDSASYLFGKVIITDSLGTIIIQKNFPTSVFIDFASILLLSNRDIILTGVADFNVPGIEDVGYTVRTDSTLYFKTVNIENNNLITANSFELYQNYPNPFNSSTIIVFELHKKMPFELNLIDISGKRIKNLVKEERNVGIYNYSLDFSGLNLSSGIYFIELRSSQTEKKIIKSLFLK